MDLVNPIVRRWLRDGMENPEAFWAKAASKLHWFRRWDETFVWEPPTFRWFAGGRLNLCWNALDFHVGKGRGGHAALVALNEKGERRVFTRAPSKRPATPGRRCASRSTARASEKQTGGRSGTRPNGHRDVPRG